MDVVRMPNGTFKYLITNEEFLSIWLGEMAWIAGYERFYKKDRLEIENIDNTLTNGEKTTWVEFRDVEVKGYVSLHDASLVYPPINISGCCFYDTFSITAGTFENFIVGKNSSNNRFVGGIFIHGGIFLNRVQIGGVGTDYEDKLSPPLCRVQIHGGTFETKLRLWSCRNVRLEIGNGVFSKGLSISGTFENVFITGGSFHDDLDLECLYCFNNIQIIGNKIGKYLSLEPIVDQHNRWVTDDTLNSHVYFNSCGISIKGHIFVQNHLVLNYINAEYFRFQVATFQQPRRTFIDTLFITNYEKSLFVNSTDLSLLYINSIIFENCMLAKEHAYRLDSIELNLLKFSNFLSLGTINLSEILGCEKRISASTELQTNSAYHAAEQHFNEMTAENTKPLLTISASDLGRAVFINCNFSSFNLNFHNSKITEIFLAGTEMPENIIADKATDYYQSRNGYGQIKKAYELRGDFLKGHEFFAKEINAYRRYLSTNKEKKAERFSLWLNHLSSNHGLSWIKAFLWTLGLGIFFFTILCMSLGYYPSLNGSVDTFLSLVGYFPTFLSPVHKSDFINLTPKAAWNSKAEFIDGISRIVLGYFIYQFIQAFRKYGRLVK